MTTPAQTDDSTDPRTIRKALLALEAALADHTVVGVSLIDHVQAWAAAAIEERLGHRTGPLLAYVRANWSTVVAAHGGIPTIEYLATANLQHELWAAISSDDPSILRGHLRTTAAFDALLKLCRAADRASYEAFWSIERDVRNLRTERQGDTDCQAEDRP